MALVVGVIVGFCIGYCVVTKLKEDKVTRKEERINALQNIGTVAAIIGLAMCMTCENFVLVVIGAVMLMSGVTAVTIGEYLFEKEQKNKG